MYIQECRRVHRVSKDHWLRSALSPHPKVDKWIKEIRGDPAGGRMQEDDTNPGQNADRFPRSTRRAAGRAQAKRRTGSDKTGRSGLHVKLHYSATHPASYSGRWRPTEKQTENANINSKPTLLSLAVWVSMSPLANNHQNYKLDKCQRAIDLGTATSPTHATFKNGTLCPQLCASSCEATALSALRLVRPQ